MADETRESVDIPEALLSAESLRQVAMERDRVSGDHSDLLSYVVRLGTFWRYELGQHGITQAQCEQLQRRLSLLNSQLDQERRTNKVAAESRRDEMQRLSAGYAETLAENERLKANSPGLDPKTGRFLKVGND